MSNLRSHPWDEAADEIAEWMSTEADYYAEALQGPYTAPFSARVSENQKLDYYRRQVFATNPDGTTNATQPNAQGREMLIKRLGIPGYTRVMEAILDATPGPITEPSDPSSELPTVPEGY